MEIFILFLFFGNDPITLGYWNNADDCLKAKKQIVKEIKHPRKLSFQKSSAFCVAIPKPDQFLDDGISL